MSASFFLFSFIHISRSQRFSVNAVMRTNSPCPPQPTLAETKEKFLTSGGWWGFFFLGWGSVEGRGLDGGGVGMAVAIIQGHKQRVIVFGGAQAVTAGMVSWLVNGEQACGVGLE